MSLHLNVANCSINTSAEFDFVFDINNFKFKPSDEYVFGIDKKQVASVKAGNTNYWVALDKTTTYKELLIMAKKENKEDIY